MIKFNTTSLSWRTWLSRGWLPLEGVGVADNHELGRRRKQGSGGHQRELSSVSTLREWALCFKRHLLTLMYYVYMRNTFTQHRLPLNLKEEQCSQTDSLNGDQGQQAMASLLFPLFHPSADVGSQTWSPPLLLPFLSKFSQQLTSSLLKASNIMYVVKTRQFTTLYNLDFPGGDNGEESTCQCRGHRFNPWSRKILYAVEQLSSCTTSTDPVV